METCWQTERDFSEEKINYETRTTRQAKIQLGLSNIIEGLPDNGPVSFLQGPLTWVGGVAILIILFSLYYFFQPKDTPTPGGQKKGDSYQTTGNQSPIITGDSNSIIFDNSTSIQDTSHAH